MCIISYCASSLCGVQPHPHLNCVNQSWPLTAEKVFDKFKRLKLDIFANKAIVLS